MGSPIYPISEYALGEARQHWAGAPYGSSSNFGSTGFASKSNVSTLLQTEMRPIRVIKECTEAVIGKKTRPEARCSIQPSPVRGYIPCGIECNKQTNCWCSAKNRKWNQQRKPSSWWFPFRGPKPGFIPTFPTYCISKLPMTSALRHRGKHGLPWVWRIQPSAPETSGRASDATTPSQWSL